VTVRSYYCISHIKVDWWAEVAQVVECLPSKNEALSQIPVLPRQSWKL
jgi:hypothetical protein